MVLKSPLPLRLQCWLESQSGVSVGVDVSVGVLLGVGVSVSVGVRVMVGVSVGVEVSVGVGLGPGVTVDVSVGVLLGVGRLSWRTGFRRRGRVRRGRAKASMYESRSLYLWPFLSASRSLG